MERNFTTQDCNYGLMQISAIFQNIGFNTQNDQTDNFVSRLSTNYSFQSQFIIAVLLTVTIIILGATWILLRNNKRLELLSQLTITFPLTV